ncbi:MAG: hypothetical protein LGB03_06435, partial [Sulfurovum sp.]|nr:hypothetical protein [Sulfurovum sp.]
IDTRLKKNIKKEWTDTILNKKMLYKCIMANTSAIWQQAAHTTYQLSSPSCSTRAIQKSLTLNEKYLRVFRKKVRRMDHEQKNDKTERARGLGGKIK